MKFGCFHFLTFVATLKMACFDKTLKYTFSKIHHKIRVEKHF